jgi:hypothetical protein
LAQTQTQTQMTDSIQARVAYLVSELTSLHGHLPYEMRSDFSWLGVNMSRGFFAPAYIPPPRPQCTALTRTGTQCPNKAPHGCEKCRIHSRVPIVREPRPRCVRDGCKCPMFKGLEVCWRHGRKEGLVQAPPTECAICYDAMTTASERKKTSCGHYFHTACLATWCTTSHARRPPCPMCRTPLSRPRAPRSTG